MWKSYTVTVTTNAGCTDSQVVGSHAGRTFKSITVCLLRRIIFPNYQHASQDSDQVNDSNSTEIMKRKSTYILAGATIGKPTVLNRRKNKVTLLPFVVSLFKLQAR